MACDCRVVRGRGGSCYVGCGLWYRSALGSGDATVPTREGLSIFIIHFMATELGSGPFEHASLSNRYRIHYFYTDYKV